MRTRKLSPRRTWPGPDEELVIRAAITEDDRAIGYWDSWLRRNDIDRLSYATYRLLPLVYRNLSGFGYESSELAKMKGAYRQSWVRNQLLAEKMEAVVAGLAEAGIPALLLKGLPLAVRTYGDMGARSMGDADVLVRPEHAEGAFARLRAVGWELARKHRFRPDRRNAVGLAAGDGLEIDLHWFPIADRPYEAAAAPFWEGSTALRLGGSELQAVNLTDQTLLAIVQGLTWEKDLPIRWIPDVILSLRRHQDELDWERFLDLSARLHVAVHAQRGFEYLLATYEDVPLPAGFIPRLTSLTRPLSDRAELWFRLRKAPHYPWGGFPTNWFQYRHRMRAAGRRAALTEFARHTAEALRDRTGTSVPRALLARASRWLRALASRSARART